MPAWPAIRFPGPIRSRLMAMAIPVYVLTDCLDVVGWYHDHILLAHAAMLRRLPYGSAQYVAMNSMTTGSALMSVGEFAVSSMSPIP